MQMLVEATKIFKMRKYVSFVINYNIILIICTSYLKG